MNDDSVRWLEFVREFWSLTENYIMNRDSWFLLGLEVSLWNCEMVQFVTCQFGMVLNWLVKWKCKNVAVPYHLWLHCRIMFMNGLLYLFCFDMVYMSFHECLMLLLYIEYCIIAGLFVIALVMFGWPSCFSDVFAMICYTWCLIICTTCCCMCLKVIVY